MSEPPQPGDGANSVTQGSRIGCGQSVYGRSEDHCHRDTDWRLGWGIQAGPSLCSTWGAHMARAGQEGSSARLARYWTSAGSACPQTHFRDQRPL